MQGRTRLTAGHFDSDNKYRQGNLRNLQYGVEIPANLGPIVFDSIDINGPIVALYGTDISVINGIKSNHEIDLIASLKAGGNCEARLDLRVGGNLSSNNVKALSINVVGNAVVKNLMHSTNDIKVNALIGGSLYCGKNVTANKSMHMREFTLIDEGLRVGSDLSSTGGFSVKILDVKRDLHINGNLDVSQNADIGRNFTVKGISTIGGSIYIGGDAYNSYIKGDDINLVGEFKRR